MSAVYDANRFAFIILLGLLLSACTPETPASEDLSIEVGDGIELPVERHAAPGDTLVLWLPSKFGVAAHQSVIAEALTERGLETWIVDLHTGYLVPTMITQSLLEFLPGDIAALIEAARTRGKTRIFVMGTGSGARPLLAGVRHWQLAHPDEDTLKGLILFHPTLYAATPVAGEDAVYLPVVREMNLPIYIFQPDLSTTHLRVDSVSKALSVGGSRVFLQRLPGVQDGFHLRPDDHLHPADHKARDALPDTLARVVGILGKIPAPQQAAPPAEPVRKKPQPAAVGLQPYTRTESTPPLALRDMNERLRDITDYRGRVVVVSFWASWCPPCIKEMPSMNRLAGLLEGQPFDILGINVGEDKATVAEFLQDVAVDFTVLRDPDNQAYRDWKVYVVPTNFVLDAHGKIRYASVGAVDWEEPDVVDIVRGLLSEPPDR